MMKQKEEISQENWASLSEYPKDKVPRGEEVAFGDGVGMERRGQTMVLGSVYCHLGIY